jgi:acetoacetyl-CoA synthetase
VRLRLSPAPAPSSSKTAIPRTKSGTISELALRDVIRGRPEKNTEVLALYRDLPELAA